MTQGTWSIVLSVGLAVVAIAALVLIAAGQPVVAAKLVAITGGGFLGAYWTDLAVDRAGRRRRAPAGSGGAGRRDRA